MLERPRVAVDAMGGDHAPEEVVRGAVDWARLHPDVEVILVGDEARIRPFIDAPLPSHVTHRAGLARPWAWTSSRAVAVRRKRDASINVCMRLVRDGEADAVVTAGHTGAGVASAILHLRRLPGVDRPALAVQMVTDRGPFMLLDIGATTDSTGRQPGPVRAHGRALRERVLGVDGPDRGAAVHRRGGGQGRAARPGRHRRCSTDGHLRFIGNVEGRDLPHHPADVVVCDASVGNVVMKFFEGLSTRHVRHAAARSSGGRPGAPSATSSCARASAASGARFDYETPGRRRRCWASTAPCSSPTAAPSAG